MPMRRKSLQQRRAHITAVRTFDRGLNKPIPITANRQLVSRKEAAEIYGCHPDTIKKMEKRNGGTLDPVKLHPKGRTVFYRLDDFLELIKPKPIEPAQEK